MLEVSQYLDRIETTAGQVVEAVDDLLIKRVEFDQISRKLRIMSENPKYPSRKELTIWQIIGIVGTTYRLVQVLRY